MGIDYGEENSSTDRWIILNDAKEDDPAYLWFDDANPELKKEHGQPIVDTNGNTIFEADGKTPKYRSTDYLPVLFFHDKNGAKFRCSGYPRQVEHLKHEWGKNTDNWVGKRIRLERKGRNIILRPAEEPVLEEPIGMVF